MSTARAFGHLGLMLGILSVLVLLDRLLYVTSYSQYSQGIFWFVFIVWMAGAACVIAEAFFERRP